MIKEMVPKEQKVRRYIHISFKNNYIKGKGLRCPNPK
jgi:hypothetical protein